MRNKVPDIFNCKVAVVGLGYVGLPIAMEIDKTLNCYKTGKNLNREIIGFDINKNRIIELQKGFDKTNEFSKEELLTVNNIKFSNSEKEIINCDVFIITVPTPIDSFNNPNLEPIKNASGLIGEII